RFIRFGGLRMSPWNSRKARFARFWRSSDRETRFSSSRRLRSQADLSGRPRPKRGLSGQWRAQLSELKARKNGQSLPKKIFVPLSERKTRFTRGSCYRDQKCFAKRGLSGSG